MPPASGRREMEGQGPLLGGRVGPETGADVRGAGQAQGCAAGTSPPFGNTDTRAHSFPCADGEMARGLQALPGLWAAAALLALDGDAGASVQPPLLASAGLDPLENPAWPSAVPEARLCSLLALFALSGVGGCTTGVSSLSVRTRARGTGPEGLSGRIQPGPSDPTALLPKEPAMGIVQVIPARAVVEAALRAIEKGQPH